MKNYIVLFILALAVVQASAQYNSLTFSGGYVFANIEDADDNASGWRINGLYEYHPITGKVVHGFSVGYINVSTEVEEVGIVSKYSIGTIPFYYAPKLLIGEGTLQGFIKGALGMQFSTLKIETGSNKFTSKDAGFYGGLGFGGMKSFNDKMFINLEYEWAYSSNSYYRDGFINSIMLGVGMKL